MNSINSFSDNVKSSRKRTGIVYCSEQFTPCIDNLKQHFNGLQVFDCAALYKGSLIFSATDLLNEIELAISNKPAIITNLEMFIVPNSFNFSEQVAKLLTIREPLKPLFFFFYSKKIFIQFKKQYEIKEQNLNNILEL